jgi:hypothetical protein
MFRSEAAAKADFAGVCFGFGIDSASVGYSPAAASS